MKVRASMHIASKPAPGAALRRFAKNRFKITSAAGVARIVAEAESEYEDPLLCCVVMPHTHCGKTTVFTRFKL